MDTLSYTHDKYGTILRTPDERFNNLPGYPFKPNYIQFRGMRIHYVDEAKENSKVNSWNDLICIGLLVFTRRTFLELFVQKDDSDFR